MCYTCSYILKERTILHIYMYGSKHWKLLSKAHYLHLVTYLSNSTKVLLQFFYRCFYTAFTEVLLQLLLTFGKFKPPLHGLWYSTVLFTLSFLFRQRKLKSFSCTHFIITSGTLNIEAKYTILEMPNALTNKVLPIRVSSRHSPRFSFVSIFFRFCKRSFGCYFYHGCTIYRFPVF